MTNVMWMILAFAIGSGTSQLSTTTAETNSYRGTPASQCYINGQWYNPCPNPEEPPPPPPDPTAEIQL